MSYANINLVYKDDELTIFPFMKNFIETLALKHPNWMFEANCRIRTRDEDGVYTSYANGFKVTEKRELIGMIGYTSSARGNEGFMVSNTRIKNGRERGDCITTKDEKKAIRHVDKWFYRETVAELMCNRANLANRKSYVVMGEHRDRAKNSLNELDEAIKRFVFANYEAFSKTLNEPKLIDIAAGLATEIENADAVRLMHDKLMNYDAFVVATLDTGNYAIQKGSDISVKSSEELDSDMRRKLGLLKLVSDGTSISEVGIKCSDDTFVVI
jgi:hypothetical protein